MVEGRSEPVGAPHPRAEASDVGAERFEQVGEQAVELVAEPAAPAAHDLVEQGVAVEGDRHAEVDVEVLERHVLEVERLELGQRGVAARPDALEVLVGLLLIHRGRR